MKNLKFSILNSLFSILFLLPLSSCQKPAASPHAVKNFPPQMVGMWKADGDYPYGFVLEECGKIKEFIRFDSVQFNLAQKQTIIDIPEHQYFAHFIPLDCSWTYEPDTNTLSVKLKLESHVEIGDYTEDCIMEDVISGTLTANGKYWEAIWGSIKNCKNQAIVNETTEKNFFFKKVD